MIQEAENIKNPCGDHLFGEQVDIRTPWSFSDKVYILQVPLISLSVCY